MEPSQATGSARVTLRLNSSLDYEDPNQRKFIIEVSTPILSHYVREHCFSCGNRLVYLFIRHHSRPLKRILRGTPLLKNEDYRGGYFHHTTLILVGMCIPTRSLLPSLTPTSCAPVTVACDDFTTRSSVHQLLRNSWSVSSLLTMSLTVTECNPST